MSTDHYAVMGNPIAHSKSPRIHTLFAEQTEQAMDYVALQVEEHDFADAVARFTAAGGRGLNITVPFKQAAWALAASRSDAAERAGAVNTLLLDGAGAPRGDNTDGTGLVRDLSLNHGAELRARRILLLGAGGAARGVLAPLLEEKPALLVIANRTPKKAVELARDFGDLGRVEGCGFDDVQGHHFDLIINGTAAGLSGEVPPIPADLIRAQTWCYDMMYGDEPTAFVRWARQQGSEHALDGLGMLVEQAAESFYLWRGVRPETGPVIQALR